MRVIESFIAGKTGNEEECEDGIFVSDDFVAVVDGATDVSGLRYEGLTGGRLAMLSCLTALENLDRAVDAVGAAENLTTALAGRLGPGLTPEQRPTASITLYSAVRREIWQIGDVDFWHSGMDVERSRMEKAVDHFSRGIRAAILSAEIERGVSREELLHNDVGREAAYMLITKQGFFCNNAQAGEWAYSAINGRPVPPHLIGVYPVAAEVTEVILASDGYPVVLPTLAQSETRLKALLMEDPLCIGALRGTKGLKPGNISFDDRSYLRVGLD